jgi:hypothetical protein
MKRLASLLAFVTVVFLLLTACGPSPLQIAILGELEKVDGEQRLDPKAYVCSIRPGTADSEEHQPLTIFGSRDEVVSFQILFRSESPIDGLHVDIQGFGGVDSIPADQISQLYLEHYASSDDASYSWGPHGGAGALPWRERPWPDALIPFRDPYDPARPFVASPFSIDPEDHPNQTVWVDIHIPQDAWAKEYVGWIQVFHQDEEIFRHMIILIPQRTVIPDEYHIDAFGELYRETGVMFDSGVKFKEHPDQDWQVYRRYLQMAHAHRFLAVHRAENGPLPRTPDGAPADRIHLRWGDDWSLYTPYVSRILDGSLFTPEQGYAGPCAGTPPAFFPAPFVEAFYGDMLQKRLAEHGGRLDPTLLETLEHNAAVFWREVERNGWRNIRWFAYIFDEVDGGVDIGEAAGGGVNIEQIHGAMRDVQAALDRGTGGKNIALLWTSHANPAQWNDTPADLRPFIRWWVPNADALDPEFFAPIAADAANRVWFYHSGQPAVGNHTINQLGIDLALWGLLCRRYPMVQGSFWWSMMSFSARYDAPDFNPYDNPTYKAGDTRWGNGVLFYPGSRLTEIGAHRNIAGPIPSMRMKAYRRGLQDYEYCWLADQAGHREEVDALLREPIPAAFADADDRPTPGAWSHNPADYDALRQKLRELTY